jgi:YidC/Oxa1 family membrane protein insertase
MSNYNVIYQSSMHLWSIFSGLSNVIEHILRFIHQSFDLNWGLSIIFFSCVVKLFLFPLGLITHKLQQQVNFIQRQLAPELAQVKLLSDAEDAHEQLMRAYKAAGVTPFYTLKPLLSTFIQIPILIAIFNVLGELPQLEGQSFLWINNLAAPDSLGHFPFSIPYLGNTFSVLPVLMTAITLYSTRFLKKNAISHAELKRQKRNVYWMSALFFLLFYPFPAAMLLFWTMNNILQVVQQRLMQNN